MLDAGIFEMKKVNKQQEKCFSTENSHKIDEFKVQVKTVESLVGLIKQNPTVGDCLHISKNENIPNLNKKNYNRIIVWRRFIELIEQKKGKVVDVYSVQARYDLLKNLPTFLLNYINDPQNDLPDSVKKEYTKICEPIINECIVIQQNDYTDSTCFSRQFKKDCKSPTSVYLLRGWPLSEVTPEFLRILGRYYFAISKKFSKDMKIELCKEQKIITTFIQNFFPQSKIPDDELSKSITDEIFIQYLSGDRKHRIFKEGMIERINQISKNLGGIFGRKFDRYGDNDTYIIYKYYTEWLYTQLGSFDDKFILFSQLEKNFIKNYREWNDDYEDESRYMEHEDPLENPSPGDEIKGRLVQLADGSQAIKFSLDYENLEPYQGRKIRILIEE